MGIRLAVARVHVPRSVRNSRLSELFLATAEAFQCQAPEADRGSFDHRLTQYALFTASNADRAMRLGRESEVMERLYLGALRMGLGIRRDLGIRTLEDAMRACEVIYRALGIDLRCGPQGEITIRSCFFSSFYSGRVCRVISSLDAGLVSGLSGGLRMEFSQRITEGAGNCRAHLVAERSSP